jgi:phospholipid N-methyltransferase
MMSDLLPFIRAWISDPLHVAAIAPSSSALAYLMTSEISSETGPVLELGPGTGVFTRALLARGVRQQDLTLIEYGCDFARLLEHRFPGARVLPVDAARLGELSLYQGTPVGAVVSGLPLLSMSRRKVLAILSGAFHYIQAGGAFYQFTYGPRCPVPRAILERLGLKATSMGRAVRNIPPAGVFRITRRTSSRLLVGGAGSECQRVRHRVLHDVLSRHQP